MVGARFSALKGVKPHEWAVRFVFGGLCTVMTALIAKRFGPGVGGLFLAFPAIFPAGASLIEAHEKEHKARIGFDGTLRGRAAASVDATGAAIGCIGLVGFAVVVWRGLERHDAYVVIGLAAVVWAVLSLGLWIARRSGVVRRALGRR
jgi:Protein of unknown function (DUF3147)